MIPSSCKLGINHGQVMAPVKSLKVVYGMHFLYYATSFYNTLFRRFQYAWLCQVCGKVEQLINLMELLRNNRCDDNNHDVYFSHGLWKKSSETRLYKSFWCQI